METKPVLGKTVSVLPSIVEKCQKNNVAVGLDALITVADEISKGQEGIHVGQARGIGTVTVVVRGLYEQAGKSYGMVRTLWKGDAGSKQSMRNGLHVMDHREYIMTCQGHGIVPYAHGCCPFCDE